MNTCNHINRDAAGVCWDCGLDPRSTKPVPSASKVYIAALDEFPDHMTPTLVAHAMLGAHLEFTKAHTDFDRIFDEGPYKYPQYIEWLNKSFRKVVLRVNQKEFDKIAALPDVYLAHENTTLEGRKSCVVVCPREETPNVLKYAKLWKPKQV